MVWLPPISIGRTRPRLPLSPHTAMRLERILLTRSRRRRYRLIRRLLARDPALLIWTLGNLSPAQRARCERIDPVARLASRHLLRWLARFALEKRSANRDATTPDESAKIAGAATAVAVLARGLVRDRAEQSTREAYFLGLLHSVRNWLALAPGKSPSETELARWLPDCCTSEVESAVAATAATRAISLLSGEAEPDDAQRALLDVTQRRRGEVQSLWRDESLSAARRLRSLVGRLARLADLEERFQETLLTEKLESLRQLAYGASHEINNPLANISARAQTLLKDETHPERRRKLAAIKAQAHRAHEMIADLMLFSRPPKLQFERIDLALLVRELADEFAGQTLAQATEIRLLGLDAELAIHADPVQLQVAIRALVTNSLEALGQGGMISISARRQTVRGEPVVRLDVSDNGPGIHADAARHLFDPFYSGREAGRGLGFGLSKCWRIVTGHGGRIDAESPPTGGARFRILLPIRPRPDASLPDPESIAAAE